MRMYEEVRPLKDEIVGEIEVRATQEERILLSLLRHPLQRPDDLALAVHLHPSSISRYLSSLIFQGLVEGVTPALGRTRTPTLSHLTT